MSTTVVEVLRQLELEVVEPPLNVDQIELTS